MFYSITMSAEIKLRQAFGDLAQIFPNARKSEVGAARRSALKSPGLGLFSLLDLIGESGRLNRGTALGEPATDEATTEIGKLALAYDVSAIEQSSATVQFKSWTCEAAEGRFMQTLHRTAQQRRKDTTAVVYFEDQKPVAFRKNYGDPTLLLLQRSLALPGVPAGTCLGLRRTALKTAEEPTQNPYLATAVFNIPANTTVNILRPLSFALSPEYVASLGYNPKPVIEREVDEPMFGAAALLADLDLIRSQLDSILENAEV